MSKLAVGAKVYTSDGQCAGYVDRIVADPVNGAPTDIVVFRNGGALDHEIVAPISALASVDRSRVTLRATLLQANSFPEYVEGDYTSPTAAWEAIGQLSQAQVLFPVTRLREAGTPSEMIAADMGVEAIDGPVGVIEEVRVDPLTSIPTSFVLRGLHNLSERFIVPIDWVCCVRGRWVIVDCNSAQIHELSETPRPSPS